MHTQRYTLVHKTKHRNRRPCTVHACMRNPFHTLTNTHNSPWGDHLSSGEEFSVMLFNAEGSDLRHSSVKFMSKQLWSHPPLYGPRRQRCPRNYEGDPIHYTPPVNSQVCVDARVSHFLCVSLYDLQHV